MLPTSLHCIQPSHSHSTWPSIERGPCWASARVFGAGTRVTVCDYDGVTASKRAHWQNDAAPSVWASRRELGGFLDGMTGRQGYDSGAWLVSRYGAAQVILYIERPALFCGRRRADLGVGADMGVGHSSNTGS